MRFSAAAKPPVTELCPSFCESRMSAGVLKRLQAARDFARHTAQHAARKIQDLHASFFMRAIRADVAEVRKLRSRFGRSNTAGSFFRQVALEGHSIGTAQCPSVKKESLFEETGANVGIDKKVTRENEEKKEEKKN